MVTASNKIDANPKRDDPLVHGQSVSKGSLKR